MEWTGSVSKYSHNGWSANRVRWRYSIERRGRTAGRRQRESRAGFLTRGAAVGAMNLRLSELDEGIAPSSENLAAFLDGWLSEKRLQVTEATLEHYRINVTGYITPGLGDYQLVDLTTKDIADFYAALSERLAPKTVRNVHAVLNQALKLAADRGVIRRNPAEVVKPPKVPRARPRDWTADQLHTFLGSSKQDRLWAAWYLSATTGMRREEVLGLRWADVDDDWLSVSWTLIEVAGKVIHQDATKSQRSVRRIALDPSTVAVLGSHRRSQLEERLAWGDGYQDHGMVFPREDGTPFKPSTFTRRFQNAAKDAGVPTIGPHGLRHTWATLALKNGTHPKIVQERLGHASVAMTLDRYSHVTEGMDRDAANVIGRLIAGGEH